MKFRSILASVLMLSSSVVMAHPGHGLTGDFAAGFSHPFTGLDHLLGMVGMGFLAGRQSPWRAWLALCAFMGSVWVGMMLGAGITLTSLDSMLATSLIIIGLMTAQHIKWQDGLFTGMAILFGLLHGLAHGAELVSSSKAIYGMLLATAVLWLIGIVLTLGGKLNRWLAALYIISGLTLLAA